MAMLQSGMSVKLPVAELDKELHFNIVMSLHSNPESGFLRERAPWGSLTLSIIRMQEVIHPLGHQERFGLLIAF